MAGSSDDVVRSRRHLFTLNLPDSVLSDRPISCFAVRTEITASLTDSFFALMTSPRRLPSLASSTSMIRTLARFDRVDSDFADFGFAEAAVPESEARPGLLFDCGGAAIRSAGRIIPRQARPVAAALMKDLSFMVSVPVPDPCEPGPTSGGTSPFAPADRLALDGCRRISWPRSTGRRHNSCEQTECSFQGYRHRPSCRYSLPFRNS